MSFNKLMQQNITQTLKITLKLGLMLSFVTGLVACMPTTTVPIDDNTFYQLQTEVKAVKNSPVADAAPLELKFITDKLQLAKKAKAEGDIREEARYTEQIRADIEVAKLRAELNGLNQQLLNKRDELSAARAYLDELREQLP